MACHAVGKKAGPRHLRSSDPNKVKYPLPHLTQNENDKVKDANKLYHVMICLIDSCIHYRVPWYIQNQGSSKLWSMPEVRKHIKGPNTRLCRYDHYMFGTPYQKPTLVLSSANDLFFAGAVSCKPRGMKCTRSGIKQQALVGKKKGKNKFRTVYAA